MTEMMDELKALNANDGQNDEIEEKLNEKNARILKLQEELTAAHEAKVAAVAEAREEARQELEDLREEHLKAAEGIKKETSALKRKKTDLKELSVDFNLYAF